MTFQIRVWKSDPGEVVDVPLKGKAATVELRCLRGASRLHVVIAKVESVCVRAEMHADPEEVVALQLETDDGGNASVRSRGRHILLLPGDDRYEPVFPIRPAAPDAPLDLVIVVDGTLRSWSKPPTSNANSDDQVRSVLLLGRKESWHAHVESLVELASRLGEGRQTRVAVVAFGDQDPPSVMAGDLQPRYRLYPADSERAFQSFDANRLRTQLQNILPTPGGDFVDALADALAACADLHWRKNARKLCVVTGDSPGVSLLDPLPAEADLCVRRYDVDTQADRLHSEGVELVTIYHAPPSAAGLQQISYQSELLVAAENQYRQLASLPELAFDASAFKPEEAVERLQGVAGPLARGAMFGELVKVAAPD